MQFLRNLPIKSKLMAITMLVSGVTLMVACAAFMIYEQAAARKQMAQALNITAAMTAANSTAGLSFNEAGSVEQALKSLKVQPDIVQACVYSKDGKPFARYVRDRAATNSPPPAVENAGCHFDSQRIHLFQPVNLAGEIIGTIYLEEDLSQMTARLWRYALIGALVLLGSAGVALFLSAWLQRYISKPLSDLAQTVAAVQAKKDYSVRATRLGEDELGRLIDGFNEMLAQMQERDAHLERRVKERTEQLAKSFSLLGATLESTTDGILVIDSLEQMVSCNSRFVEMWGLPREKIAMGGTDQALPMIVALVKDGEGFLAKVRELHTDREAESSDVIELKDGRIFERYSKPQRLEGKSVGRVWSFRDVTERRLAERELRWKTTLFEALLNSSPDGILVVSPAGKKLILNGPMISLWKIPQAIADESDDEAMLKCVTAATLNPDEFLERVRDYYDQPDKIGRDEISLKDGTVIDRYTAPLNGKDGTHYGRIWLFQDITQQKHAETELAKSLSTLNATLDSTADGILVVNAQAKKIFQNRRMVELWKIPPDIAENEDDNVQVEYVLGTVIDPAKLRAQIAHFYSHPNEKGQDEVQLKDGTIMERITAPVLDHEGRNYGRIWTFRDITRSKKYEVALRESQARFKFIFESVPVGIASRMVHPDGRVAREVNNACLQICGLEREQYDQPEIYAKLDHPDDRERQQELMSQVNAGHLNQFSVEKRYLRLDGTTVWVVFSYQRQRYADGGFEELTTLVDITESKRAEDALRESEASYYSLVDQMPAGIFRKDKDGRYVFVNSWFCRTRDAKPKEYLGKLPLEIKASAVQGPDLNRLFAIGTQHHQTIMETGRHIEVEEQFTMPDGRVVHHHVVKSPVFGPDGAVVGSQGILLDITQRKLAEGELARERELLQALMEGSKDYIYFKDIQSRFIAASHSQARRFGASSPDEVAGKTDFDFFSEDHARPAFEDEQRIVRTGQPIIGKMEREFWKDGRGESWVLTTKMPLRNKAGEITGTFGISKDITAIKQVEAALAYERDLLAALLDQSPDCIFFKDRQSHYVRTSRSEVANLFQAARDRHAAQHPSEKATDLPAHLTSLEPFHDYIIGKSDADIYGPERAGEFGRDEAEIIRSGKPVSGKLEKTICPNGQTVWFLINKTPWHNKEGEIIGTFGTARNITDLKLAEAKIEKTHQQLLETSRLAGMAEVATSVLHNVGNVLNSVNVSTTLALELVKKSRLNNLGRLAAMINDQQDIAAFFTTDTRGKQLPGYLTKLAEHLVAEQSELAGEIELTRKNVEHIKDIVTMQQSYAKVSGVTEKVKVTDLVEDALRMNAGALTRHNVQIARDYPAEPSECNVERQKVLQILVNLIRNAKYACDDSQRPDKLMTIQVRVGDGRAQIAVQDNGVGIPAENMTRIFNHGFTTRETGHGFGLHSGALAAKELGGSLTAYSDGPGAGAKFVLDLPLQPLQKS